MTAPPVVALEYAVPRTLDHSRQSFRLMLIVSIMCGPTVGICIPTLVAPQIWFLPHVGVFAATIFLAIRTGIVMARSGIVTNHPWQMPLDLLSLVGLAFIGLAPIGYLAMEATGIPVEKTGALLLSIGYAMMAVTTMRHVMLYRRLADVCREINRYGLAKGLYAMGWVKTVYEAIWLGMCALALFLVAMRGITNSSSFEEPAIFFGFGALITTIGFTGIWIWMIVMHALLFRLTRSD